MAAELGQTTAQFGLENHDQSDGQENRKAANDPSNDDEI